MNVAEEDGVLETLTDLLGRRVYSQDQLANTLQWVVLKRFPRAVRLLLAYGASPSRWRQQTMIPKIQDLEILRALHEHGLDIHADDDIALTHACFSRNQPVARYLLRHDADVATATSNQREGTVAALLARGDADARAELAEMRAWGQRQAAILRLVPDWHVLCAASAMRPSQALAIVLRSHTASMHAHATGEHRE